MNSDEKGMNTDDGNCFAKHLNHPCSSVDIRARHLQPLRFRGDHHSADFAGAHVLGPHCAEPAAPC
jgi:hypothetical protein